MPASPIIEKPKQLVVEGYDEVRIFSALLDHLNISDVQIQNIRGVVNLRRRLRTLSGLREFDGVRSLAVVADTNSDRAARRNQIRGSLANAGLPVPSEPLQMESAGELSVAYLIVPHDGQGTMMEDVCLESVRTDPAMKCVDDYFECVGQANIPGPRDHWLSKARAHAFLASRQRPYLRLGEAAESGVWNFDSDTFNPLKDLLNML